MAERKAEEAVRYIRRHLVKAGLAGTRVILFGSHARGASTPESDVDLAVVSPAFRGKDVFECARLIKEAEINATRRFALPFDIVMLTPEEFEGDSMIADFIRSASATTPG